MKLYDHLTLAMAAGALVMAGAIANPTVIPTPATPSVVHSVPQIEEDEPGWDCATMGNRICGPGADG
ncbi:hypothetical protein D2E33_04255 [Mycobacteroides abscessus]|uniref:hypothetical protein n=1 Tax=Mycobacteroides abscessus TaxID=36809 RepID=UPI000C2691DD|nr:hypothetical protein [Mycobacteroides abscessus]RIR62901.1 hypothetical protein D2E33_04255 [Mycobacteroides abscessus]